MMELQDGSSPPAAHSHPKGKGKGKGAPRWKEQDPHQESKTFLRYPTAFYSGSGSQNVSRGHPRWQGRLGGEVVLLGV